MKKSADDRGRRSLLDRFLDMSPRNIFERLGLARRALSKAQAIIHQEPLARRFEGGRLKGLSPDYMKRRSAGVRRLLEAVRAAGDLDDDLLLDPELSRLDERVVEYPWILARLLRVPAEGGFRLLDAGCVLNSPEFRDAIQGRFGSVWFMNPSRERLHFDRNVVYAQCDIRRHCLPEGLRFERVTCLSTLEHVGMNNQRYGGGRQEFDGPIDDPQRFAVEAVRFLSRLVALEGKAYISVPFGPFEFLYKYERPEDPIYYTFDRDRLFELVNALDCFDCSVTVYKVVPGTGWRRTEPEDEDILRHADRCAAAGAVAFIEAIRRK